MSWLRLLLSLCFTTIIFSAQAEVAIVAPAELLHDADLRFVITGLTSGATYDVQSDFASRGASLWRSTATFIADDRGSIDPSTQAPVAGSWDKADPHAFLWSMAKTSELPATTAVLESDDQSVVTITVLQDKKKLAERRVTLIKRANGVSTTEIRGPLVGTFFVPYGKSSLPAVIVLGGSEGGINRDRAALIASHGYATLALAYFGIPPLPNELDRVPVEIVDKAVAWLGSQPSVDKNRIVVLGGSKGAELALLAASNNPSIHAVIAFAPSSVVFESISEKKVTTSSWTIKGVEVPFAPYVASDAYSKSHRLVDLYLPTLAAAPPSAFIPIEKINGPILLLSGKEDALWPSAAMATQIEERAKRMHFKHPVTQLMFDDAGHHVATLPNRPTADSVRLGGTAAGLEEAQYRSWKAIFDFLGNAFTTPRN